MGERLGEDLPIIMLTSVEMVCMMNEMANSMIFTPYGDVYCSFFHHHQSFWFSLALL
jgi:hypothetical protein